MEAESERSRRPRRPLILASGSPRRRELLHDAGFDVEVVVPDVVEVQLDGESPAAMVVRLAVAKARAVASVLERPALVLGCDTAVVADGEALGKPDSPDDAVEALLRLSDNAHTVLTGFAIVDAAEAGAEPVIGIESTVVFMKPITMAMALEYVATGEPLDKAGSYAIQGLGGDLVDRYQGSYTNIVGLPLEAVTETLGRLGVFPEYRQADDQSLGSGCGD
jgi:septum formation protein